MKKTTIEIIKKDMGCYLLMFMDQKAVKMKNAGIAPCKIPVDCFIIESIDNMLNENYYDALRINLENGRPVSVELGATTDMH